MPFFVLKEVFTSYVLKEGFMFFGESNVFISITNLSNKITIISYSPGK
ncbi:hypothetical protein BLGI_3079 [Brevibacillus laterosporus GI-9]|nr:hypothetical protein BLGI_3079 [Brevibacillus laterosporus GI-9]